MFLQRLHISIAGAKLSHLVQKDKIWDYGSMTEQVRIIFYQLQKVTQNGNTATLKKYMTISCFEGMEQQILQLEKQRTGWHYANAVITELAIIAVQPGKQNKPDKFTALIKGYNRVTNKGQTDKKYDDKFSTAWYFVRQGDWWILDRIK